jgi:hypothetical protein
MAGIIAGRSGPFRPARLRKIRGTRGSRRILSYAAVATVTAPDAAARRRSDAHYTPHFSLQTHTTCHRGRRYIERIKRREIPMKRIAVLAALAIVLGSVLGGCIVVPEGGGYYHHRDNYYRY